MAAVEITISGMLYDKLARTTQNVVLIGEATLTGLGVGGGPIYPPQQPPGGGGPPPGIWPGPGDPDFPGGGKPPGIWGGGNEPFPTPPIHLPPNVPPPEHVPQPGDPTTALPGNWPVQPVTPPPFVVINYPGIGPIVVPPPASSS